MDRLVRSSPGIHLLAPKVCRLDNTREGSTEPGRDGVAVAEDSPIHLELPLWMPEHQIGVVPRSDRTLPSPETHQPRGTGTEPLRESLRWMPSRAGKGPGRGEPKLERRDAAPGSEEVTLLSQLERRRRRRMVAHHH